MRALIVVERGGDVCNRGVIAAERQQDITIELGWGARTCDCRERLLDQRAGMNLVIEPQIRFALQPLGRRDRCRSLRGGQALGNHARCLRLGDGLMGVDQHRRLGIVDHRLEARGAHSRSCRRCHTRGRADPAHQQQRRHERCQYP
ncbi:hypothetical protein QH494_02730 [Sphingomonas sp. AR_OL41]|uniref:hypothetical protein n=1 Tax=Sphingomonas sp. AR_OL41 TaxID=3042729 RepID=UPI002481883C|nr:hypothetical protein [Sphingomonas sp. AR_OL41]MDH7971084.1 hypothetical protein [Sphingomonas sp. AR_OL41]